MTGNFFVVEVLRGVEISRVEISIRVKKGIGEGKTLLVTVKLLSILVLVQSSLLYRTQNAVIRRTNVHELTRPLVNIKCYRGNLISLLPPSD